MKKQKMRTGIALVAILLVLMFAMTACSQTPSAESADAPAEAATEVEDSSAEEPSEPLEAATEVEDSSAEEPSEPQEATYGGEQFTIAYSVRTVTNDAYQKTLADALQEAVEGAGHVFELVTAGAGDSTAVATQVKQVEDLVVKGVDAIVVNPMDLNALIPALKVASEAGIPVALVDQSISENEDLYITYFGTDNHEAGVKAGELMKETLGGTGNVLICRGANGSSATAARVEGFKAAIEGTDIKVVGEQAHEWSDEAAMEVAENMLQANKEVAGFFSVSDTILDGITEAINNSGRAAEIKIVSVDGEQSAVDRIEEGEIVGTISQFPKEMGRLSAEMLIKILSGEESAADQPKFYDTGAEAFTIDNIDYARSVAY